VQPFDEQQLGRRVMEVRYQLQRCMAFGSIRLRYDQIATQQGNCVPKLYIFVTVGIPIVPYSALSGNVTRYVSSCPAPSSSSAPNATHLEFEIHPMC
jgi:hypothetical protein